MGDSGRGGPDVRTRPHSDITIKIKSKKIFDRKVKAFVRLCFTDSITLFDNPNQLNRHPTEWRDDYWTNTLHQIILRSIDNLEYCNRYRLRKCEQAMSKEGAAGKKKNQHQGI